MRLPSSLPFQATLDEDEFIECICRCGRDKYDEVQPMAMADGIRGFIQNLLGEKGDEAVIRDKTYIKADRYDWHLSKPLKGQTLAHHRKWLDVWQLIEIADLHYFPLWEKDVHDVLQSRFKDLMSIFSHYSKSIGGSTTVGASLPTSSSPALETLVKVPTHLSLGRSQAEDAVVRPSRACPLCACGPICCALMARTHGPPS